METRRLILKATDIEGMEGERRIHFLNPNADRVRKSLGDAVGLNHVGIHLVQVEPGKNTTEYHRHYQEEECIYVLAGSGTLLMEDEKFEIGKGDFIGFPAGGPAHTITNTGPDLLVCLVMGQRLEHDVADYPHQGKRLYRNSGKWDLVDLEQVVTMDRGA